jgi:hypothetical protein
MFMRRVLRHNVKLTDLTAAQPRNTCWRRQQACQLGILHQGRPWFQQVRASYGNDNRH